MHLLIIWKNIIKRYTIFTKKPGEIFLKRLVEKVDKKRNFEKVSKR